MNPPDTKDGEPHRAGMIQWMGLASLAFGIASCIPCTFGLGFFGYTLGLATCLRCGQGG